MSANCYYRYHCYFQLFNKYVQGCVLGTGNMWVNKATGKTCSHGAYIPRPPWEGEGEQRPEGGNTEL